MKNYDSGILLIFSHACSRSFFLCCALIFLSVLPLLASLLAKANSQHKLARSSQAALQKCLSYSSVCLFSFLALTIYIFLRRCMQHNWFNCLSFIYLYTRNVHTHQRKTVKPTDQFFIASRRFVIAERYTLFISNVFACVYRCRSAYFFFFWTNTFTPILCRMTFVTYINSKNKTIFAVFELNFIVC